MEADSDCQLARQFSRLSTYPTQAALQPTTRCPEVIDLAIEDLRLSSPQLFVSQSQSPLYDVIVTCRVINFSPANRCSPPGCHLRWRRGGGFSQGPERLLLPQLPARSSVACELRLRAPVTAPTGWHRFELQLHSPLGSRLEGEAASRCFDVHVAAEPPMMALSAQHQITVNRDYHDDDVPMVG